jgi:hypothetical protein
MIKNGLLVMIEIIPNISIPNVAISPNFGILFSIYQEKAREIIEAMIRAMRPCVNPYISETKINVTIGANSDTPFAKSSIFVII